MNVADGPFTGAAAALLYHGTRAALQPGAHLVAAPYVLLTPTLDAAIWSAELAEGDGMPAVYVVEPLEGIEDASALPGWVSPGHPVMSWRTQGAVRVVHEVIEWRLYHGTRAALQLGDLITAGYGANYGAAGRTANHVYCSRTLDAAAWGAELALGEGPGRIYVVEPTGPIEDDPNVTNRKFRGNPTRSYRSRHPLRVVGEVTPWVGHPPATIQAMRDGLDRLAQSGEAKIDD